MVVLNDTFYCIFLLFLEPRDMEKIRIRLVFGSNLTTALDAPQNDIILYL